MANLFRSLRHPNYRLWFYGQTVSLVGTWMQTVAQQVLIYRLTGSAAALGIINFLGLIPLLPLSLWGGSLSDRFPKRAIILWAQVAMLLQAVLLAVLVWTNTVEIWHVYALAMLLSAATAIDLPARQAFTVEMVEGKADLTNAIALNSAMFNASRAIGPALAGVIVAAAGEGWAFMINAVTFLAVIASLLLMRNLPQAPPQPVRNTLEHLQGGFRYILQQRTILVLVSLVAVSAFLSMPYNTLLPVFAGDILQESAAPLIAAVCGGARPLVSCQSPEALPLGILFSLVGVGALVGALSVAALPDTANRGRYLTTGNLTFPALLLGFAVSRSFWLSSLLMMLVGMSFVWQNALANTLLQFATPDELRGRVMSFYTLSFQTMFRLGGLQAGYVSDWVSAPFAVGIGALASFVYGAYIALRYPKIRNM